MPAPGKNENQQDFVSRCIKKVMDDGSAKDTKQAAAMCYSMWREAKKEMDDMPNEDLNTKMLAEIEIMEPVMCFPLGGATTFAEVEETKQAQEAAWQAESLTYDFRDLVSNIMRSDIEDKGGAIKSLTEEFIKKLDEVPKTKSLWNKVKELLGKEKKASDYLVVEDPDKPSTWHLPVKKNGKPDHRLMGAAWAALHGGYRGNKYEGPNKQAAITKLKKLYASEGLDTPSTKEKQDSVGNEQTASPFMVWKEASGTWRWLAVYSNKFRDNDNPPEIIEDAAHRDFVKSVDEGRWPMPELWLWHVKGTRSGAADLVAYDESGFSLASGSFDADKAEIAEKLAAMDDLLTSHGMPIKEIKRDETDPTILSRYRTIEISPLPAWAAANPYNTTFAILSKEVDMALPDEKRRFLSALMGEEAVTALEQQLGDKAKELVEQGVDYKEQAQPEPVPETKEEVSEEAPVPTPQWVTAEEVATAFGAYLKPVLDRLRATENALAQLTGEIKEVQKAENERLKELVAETPAASLIERIGSAIGDEKTALDGRSALAKAGPKETKGGEDGSGPTPSTWLNELMARQRGG